MRPVARSSCNDRVSKAGSTARERPGSGSPEVPPRTGSGVAFGGWLLGLLAGGPRPGPREARIQGSPLRDSWHTCCSKKSLETPKSVVAEMGVESVPASEPERATAGGGGSFRSRLFPRWLLSRRCGEAWELLLPGPLPPTPLLPLLPLNPLASASVPPNNACPLQPAWLSAGAPCPLTLPCLSEGHYGDLSLRGRVLGAGPACSRPPRVHP